jgi:hypothetical protein
MPSGKNYKRDYKQEAKYHATAEQKKKRASRNAARAKLKNAGVNVAGKDVDHKNGNAKDNKRSNLRVQSKAKNRSFARTKTAGKKK